MEIQFKTRNDKQLQAVEYWIDDTTQEILYGGAKGGGKSFLGASLIFGDALIYPGTHYFIARKELNDLRKFTVPTIYEVFKKWDLSPDDYMSFNGQDNCFHLKNGSKVFLISCSEVPSDPLFERFGSMQMTRGWIEEGGEVPENAKANLWLSVGRWMNQEFNLKKKLLITANPKKGWMKKEFVDPSRGGYLSPTRAYVQAFATDNTYLPPDYIESLKNERDAVRRQRLWEGNWDYDEDMDSLITFDALTDTFSNTITKDNQKYLVADVARLGQDSTVFSFWDGLEVYKIQKFEKQDTQKTIQSIRDYASSEKIPYSNILIDEDGIGGSVVDGLFGVKGFIANSTPLPTATEIIARQSKVDNHLIPKRNYRNLKSQCAFKLAELINERRISFKVPEYRDEIIEDLTAMLRQKDIDGDGKMQVISKEDVKQALGHSPDVGDSIMMRAWFELRKGATGEDPNREVTINLQKNKMAMNRRNFTNNSNK